MRVAQGNDTFKDLKYKKIGRMRSSMIEMMQTLKQYSARKLSTDCSVGYSSLDTAYVVVPSFQENSETKTEEKKAEGSSASIRCFHTASKPILTL